MESAVLGWVSQGLQHEVIEMASCCKKGGGQKGNNCHRQTCTGTTGITVLRRDSGVVAGADLRHWTVAHIPILTDLTAAPAHQPAHSPQQKEHYRVLPFHPGFWYRNGCEMFFACQRSFGCALVSSEVSHRTATMVSRCRACRAWLAHSGYPLGHVPRSPRTAIDACAIRRMLSHLEAHSAI